MWVIDLSGNGGNIQGVYSENFDQWINIFPHVVDFALFILGYSHGYINAL